MPSLVALDIETTGLDPQRDVILEVAAVRFSGHRVEDEWSSLVNPGRHIPEQISQLTGITDEMVRHAPHLQEVLNEFEAFIGDSPIVGHNVRFDLSFLQRQRILAHNDVNDTYELASVLLPSASRYNLAALGQLLGIPLPATHRALDDARVTHGVFVRLYDRAMEIPLELIAEITRLGEPLDWDGNWTFREILKARSKKAAAAPKRGRRKKSAGQPPETNRAERRELQPLQPVRTPIPLDVDEVASLLEYGGPFSQHFEFYEHRHEQVEMLRAVTNSLSYSAHLMVEAGTGVGKSFAYLVPSALFALQNNTRVVISTNTINLQDQLIQKDIPNLREALNIDLRAAVLKGRSNYLCPRRLEILREQGPNDSDEMRVLAKVLVWQLENTAGDRNDITLIRPGEKESWLKLSAEDEACSSENCAGRMGGTCPFYRARQSAQTAHILIVNHALLLSDVVTGSKVLPDYQYLIIDEAHHLEAATTGALSFHLTQNDFERLLREIGSSPVSALGHLLNATRELLKPSEYAKLNQSVQRAVDLAFRLQTQSRDFFNGLGEFMQLQREGVPRSQYAFQIRILPSTRTLPGWDNIEIIWQAAGETMRLLIKCIEELYKNTTELYNSGVEEVEDSVSNLSNIYRRLTEVETAISGMIHDPAPDIIYWTEIQPSGNRLTLYTAPLRVGPLIEKYLWHEKESVVLTSATLTAAGDFTYIRNALQADEADVLALGSPFDYESSTLLFLAKDIPEPNAPGYEQAINRALVQLCKVTGGRTLVLFTSYAQLKRTSQAITHALADQDIQVYEQGEGASPASLLDSFKSNERAVLLGTRSFWEGVDVPGEALSVVVITKLPFGVPTDPLIAARSETFEDPFGEYQLPEAILRFRQGFGRLIRSASDRGVVAILDRRILTKAYGSLFIQSLPVCTVHQAPASELPKMAARWLGY
jgi:ATP-dependent DNA helicase DinG